MAEENKIPEFSEKQEEKNISGRKLEIINKKNQKTEERQLRLEEKNNQRLERRKVSFKKSIVRCLALIIIAICVTNSVHIIVPAVQDFLNKGEKITDAITGKVIIPYSADYFKFRDCEDVKNQLHDMGFKEVDVEEVQTNFGIIYKSGTIQAVRIKGNQNFSANKKYDDGDHVVIKKYVNAANYKEKYIFLFLSLILISVCISFAVSKKKTIISVLSAVAVVAIVFSWYLVDADLKNENSKYAFLAEKYKVELKIISKKQFLKNNYDIAVKIDGKKQDSKVSAGSKKEIGPLELKRGRHTILVYNIDNNDVSASKDLNIQEDMSYTFNVIKKKDSIELKVVSKDYDSAERTEAKE